MIAKFRNGGQACTAANRFFVHAGIAAEFTSRFGAAVEALKVGHAFAPGTEIGPLVSDRAVAGVQAWVDRAFDAGAQVSHQGYAPIHDGTFFAPTVIVGLPMQADVLQEEIFGPVAPIITWHEERELLAAINGTELGLAAYVFSQDLGWALRLSERIEAGMVGVNRGVVSDPSAPFGGVKQSGLGREGAREGLRAYMETQSFSVAWDAP
jgi:succinate-semialdehyde dehydrogenase/glutarate-semialdehyde dehydrogenase